MVYVHFADGFEEIEALMVIDVLRRAEVDVRMVSVSDSLTVTGGHGICVQTDLKFEDADYEFCEMIVLPGGMPGTKNLYAHQGLKNQILKFDDEGKWLAAICAAPMVLGELGLLKNHKAVCYPGWEKHLLGAELTEEPYVVSGNIITGRGVGVADLFALGIVKVLKGEENAISLSHKMLVEGFKSNS